MAAKPKFVRVPAPAGFPDHVVIRGEYWPIEYVRSLTDKGKPMMGMTYFVEHLIRISTKYHPRDIRDTLLHEINHVYIHRSPIEFSGKLEERVCDLFASAVVDLTQNNAVGWLDFK